MKNFLFCFFISLCVSLSGTGLISVFVWEAKYLGGTSMFVSVVILTLLSFLSCLLFREAKAFFIMVTIIVLVFFGFLGVYLLITTLNEDFDFIVKMLTGCGVCWMSLLALSLVAFSD